MPENLTRSPKNSTRMSKGLTSMGTTLTGALGLLLGVSLRATNKLSADEKEWLGNDDPDYLDIEEVNDILSDGETIDEESFF
jgi:hypothetical protein